MSRSKLRIRLRNEKTLLDMLTPSLGPFRAPIWQSDDLRDFVAEVSNHPTVFPPDVAVPMSSPGSEIDLSSGFVENVYRRKGGSSKDLSLKELSVLLVTHVSKAMKESRSGISLK